MTNDNMETLNNHSDPNPSREEIAFYAYLAWEKDGRQTGQDQKYWLQAEAQLRDSRMKRAVATPAQPEAASPTPVVAGETAGEERLKSKVRPAVKTTGTARKPAPTRQTRQRA